MIQIKGAVKFPITPDSITWIFGDRKVSIEDLEKGVFDDLKPADSEDNHEWNRAILEGQISPPILNSEIKYKKRAMLGGSPVINMIPFFKHSEPYDSATTTRLSSKHDHLDISIDLLPYLFFQLVKDGKRFYSDDGVDSFTYNQEDGYSYRINHVTYIEVI